MIFYSKLSIVLVEAGKEFVKVYIEKPIEGGFKNIICYLPEYRWEKMTDFQKKLKSFKRF